MTRRPAPRVARRPARAAARARRLRREATSRPAPPADGAAHARARLLPQRRPRRHLRRAGARPVPPRRASTCSIVTPSRPGAPLKLLAGRAGRPGDLLRARAAAGPRQGRRARLGRRARAAPADVDHVASARAAITRAGRSCAASAWARRASRTSRPTCKTIAKSAGVDPSTVKRGRTSASTSSRRCSPSKVDATLGAFWNYEGIQLQREQQAPAHHPRRPAGRPDLRRARARRPRRTTLRDGRRALRRFLLALAEGHAGRCARDPAAGVDAAREGQPRPRPRAPARVGARDAARRSSPPTAHALGAGRTSAPGRRFGTLDATTNGLLKRPPATARGADERVPAGRGARAAGRRRRAA